VRRAGWLFAALLSVCASGEPAVVDPARAAPITSVVQLRQLTGSVAHSLEVAKAIRGKFTQSRRLAGLAKPLQSSGTFLFARSAGIEWHTLSPFDSQFLLTDAGITQHDEGGATLRIDTADQPALAVVSRVFFALFSLDYDALSRDFTIAGYRKADRWTLLLQPRSDALRRVFRQALLTGQASVDQVTLEEGNGDSSVIDLSGVQYDAAGLTADERRRF
jgi:hypothetical protein